MLGGILGIDIHVRTTGRENIAYTKSEAGSLIFQEFIFQRSIYPSRREGIALRISADRATPATANITGTGRTARWQDCLGGIVAGDLKGEVLGYFEGHIYFREPAEAGRRRLN